MQKLLWGIFIIINFRPKIGHILFKISYLFEVSLKNGNQKLVFEDIIYFCLLLVEVKKPKIGKISQVVYNVIKNDLKKFGALYFHFIYLVSTSQSILKLICIFLDVCSVVSIIDEKWPKRQKQTTQRTIHTKLISD